MGGTPSFPEKPAYTRENQPYNNVIPRRRAKPRVRLPGPATHGARNGATGRWTLHSATSRPLPGRHRVTARTPAGRSPWGGGEQQAHKTVHSRAPLDQGRTLLCDRSATPAGGRLVIHPRPNQATKRVLTTIWPTRTDPRPHRRGKETGKSTSVASSTTAGKKPVPRRWGIRVDRLPDSRFHPGQGPAHRNTGRPRSGGRTPRVDLGF